MGQLGDRALTRPQQHQDLPALRFGDRVEDVRRRRCSCHGAIIFRYRHMSTNGTDSSSRARQGTSALARRTPDRLGWICETKGEPAMSVHHHALHPTADSGSTSERLTITLEPLHGNIFKSIANILGPMGAGTWRFVAVTDAEERVEGPTFISPRNLGGDQTPHP